MNIRMFPLIIISFAATLIVGCGKSENKAPAIKGDGIKQGVKVIIPGVEKTTGTVELAPEGGDLVLIRTKDGEDMIAPRKTLKIESDEAKNAGQSDEPKKSH